MITTATEDLELVLSRRRAARALGIGIATLDRMERDGVGPPSFTLGKRRLYPIGQMADWLDSQTHKPADD